MNTQKRNEQYMYREIYEPGICFDLAASSDTINSDVSIN